MTAEVLYDRIGRGYALARKTDPRIAAAIEEALGDAGTVLNVGAGAGSYEPEGREVTAVEPSAEMIAQRPAGAAPVVRASAEALPFEDDGFDAAMALQTVHHWPDMEAGLAEMRRVARRTLILTNEAGPADDLWLNEYFPGAPRGGRTKRVTACLEGATVTPVPVPRDCADLFFWALWARPELFLDDQVVQSMWIWNIMDPEQRQAGRERLAADLADGSWDRRHGALREADALDVGLRIVSAERV
ncbi:MAG TPA: class I SAM-dependent methyltransferase [Solirubrobacterales bacterium]|jgi:SAM-dependent methyltransferase|nr:class I SAM-dependent methyltransferase [Solirubrobacterales bacterium]